MRITVSIILLSIIFSLSSFGQTKVSGTVKGIIVDTASSKQNLEQATVSVTPGTDSSATQFVVTNKQGAFMLRYLKAATYHMIISFEGYQPIFKKFTIDTGNLVVDFGTFYMQRQTDQMAAVIISRPPMGIKGDTVEYNAAMYTTKPNAVAEDLLKKFPGIQVDASGNITAQGETVQRVLVNGKRFFNDDPKMATRNLPPDVIEKIQVFDDLDDQSKFSGFDDGNREIPDPEGEAADLLQPPTKVALASPLFGQAALITGIPGGQIPMCMAVIFIISSTLLLTPRASWSGICLAGSTIPLTHILRPFKGQQTNAFILTWSKNLIAATPLSSGPTLLSKLLRPMQPPLLLPWIREV